MRPLPPGTAQKPPPVALKYRSGLAPLRDGVIDGRVNPLVFDDLIRFPVIKLYEETFRKATGVSLGVVPPGELRQRQSLGAHENELCTLLAATPAGCTACMEAQATAHRGAARKLAPQQVSCFAGLTDVAVPVMVGGRHVATLISGQVFRREPTERDFQIVVGMVGQGPEWEGRVRRAYFATPVASPEKLDSVSGLLAVRRGEHHRMAEPLEHAPTDGGLGRIEIPAGDRNNDLRHVDLRRRAIRRGLAWALALRHMNGR